MRNRAFINDKGFVEQKFVGDQTAKTIVELTTQTVKAMDKVRKLGKPVYVISDISKIGKITAESRKKVLEDINNIDFDKSAVYGADLFNLTVASFVIMATSYAHKIKVFRTREQAEAWLLADK